MEFYNGGRPAAGRGVPIRGYMKRSTQEWRKIRLFESTEQRICEQERTIIMMDITMMIYRNRVGGTQEKSYGKIC